MDMSDQAQQGSSTTPRSAGTSSGGSLSSAGSLTCGGHQTGGALPPMNRAASPSSAVTSMLNSGLAPSWPAAAAAEASSGRSEALTWHTPLAEHMQAPADWARPPPPQVAAQAEQNMLAFTWHWSHITVMKCSGTLQADACPWGMGPGYPQFCEQGRAECSPPAQERHAQALHTSQGQEQA